MPTPQPIGWGMGVTANINDASIMAVYLSAALQEACACKIHAYPAAKIK